MSFISYAQNFEDVILYRVFKDVKNGAYIDVGANDPEVDSVTKLFYDQGWRGINIEPVESSFERLCEERPHDINIRTAAGDREGMADFYEVVDTGLSTMDKSVAERHARDHGYEVRGYKVPITRLSTVLEKHAFPEIHFLKIDVEGAERQVLQGLDLKKTRPWICIVEATRPNLREEDFEDWETIILSADYEFAYFDGLNRFYVAKEHQELQSTIAKPPNVFDDFNLSGKSHSTLHYQVEQLRASETNARERNKHTEAMLKDKAQQITLLESKLENAKSLAHNLRVDIDQLQSAMTQQELELENLKTELQAVYASKSWQVTKPLRILWRPFEKQ